MAETPLQTQTSSSSAVATQTAVAPQPGAIAVVAQKPKKPVTPTVEQVMAVTGKPRSAVERNLIFILKAMAEAGLTSKNQLIGVMATFATETPFNPVREGISQGKANADYGGWLGNDWANDGYFYRGGGYIQLTGKGNYERAAKDLKLPELLKNPDVLKDPAIAAKVSFWFWKGGNGSNNPAPAAERADWRQVRIQVNGGLNGYEEFLTFIEKGKRIFTEGIDAEAIGVAALPANFGTNCIDPGAGGSRDLAGGGFAPTSQADAIAMALGLHLLDRQMAIKWDALINPQDYPELLSLEPQDRFEGKNFGEGLDGEVTVDQIVIFCGGSLEMRMLAYQPDPNAAALQVFAHNAQLGANHNTALQAASPAAATTAPAGSLLLPVPYVSQRTAKINPDGVCNTACSTMCAQFFGKKITIDEMYQSLQGDTKDHGVQVAALSKLGIACQAGSIGFDELDKRLNDKKPVCIGIQHRGTIENSLGGHVLVVIGRTPSGDFIVNDPYGDLNDQYATTSGAGKIYRRAELAKRWTLNGPSDGVARWFA